MLNSKGEWEIQSVVMGKESLWGAEGLREEAGFQQVARSREGSPEAAATE